MARPRDGVVRELERQWRPALLRFCAGYLGSETEAEDAVQDVFAKVLEAPEVPRDPKVWLYVVARRHCLNLLRSRRRRAAEPLPPASSLPASRTGFLTALVALEDAERVVAAFASLTTEEQELLRLRYAEALSRAEVAELLELPPSLVKSRLYEAMVKLRRRLETESTS